MRLPADLNAFPHDTTGVEVNIPEVPFLTIGVEVRSTSRLPAVDKLADLS